MRPSTDSSETTAPDVELGIPWNSIRFRISLLLLLSALNGIAVLALAVALLASEAEDSAPSGPEQVQQVLAELAPLHRQLAEGEVEPESLVPLLDRLGGALLEAGPEGQAALASLRAYRRELDAAARMPPRAGGEQVTLLDTSFHRLFGAIHMMTPEDPGGDPERRDRWMVGLLMLWVIAVTAITVASAFSLRRALSLPLSAIARAAMQVAGGALEAPIPSPVAAREFRQLGQALETMRRELVRSISRLDQQNRLVKAMLDALGDGVLLLDRARRVIEHNPAAARHLRGLSPVPFGGGRRCPVAELIPGLDPALFDARSGEPVRLRFPLEGGTERHLEICVEPVEGVGQDLDRAFVLVLHDVTRDIELEKLQRNFLSVVTHELKTPLTVIEGYVRLLEMGKGGDLTARQAEMLGKVRGQAEVLRTMVQDLLDATRLEGGHLKLEPSEVPAARPATKVVEALRPEALSRHLDLALALGEGADAGILVDEFRLEQVLGNLLRNALKFTEAQGRVELSVRRSGERVLFCVRDDGRGIPEAAQPHLFEKFFQVEASDTRKAGGAGLGLYICDQLVRAMGGTIEVASEVGKGSAFTVAFPALPAAPDDAREPRSEA